MAAAVVAVLGFWVLGAYNRLVALRNAVAGAWSQADEAQRRRGEGTEQLLGALRGPLAAEQGALDALWAAQAQSARAAGGMSARPLLAANALAWTEGESRLGAAAARVFALADGHANALSDEAAAATVGAARAAWSEGSERLSFARRLYNDAAAAHDDAIATFPTSLLVPVFGFAPAGRI
ncbi:MAG: LemA family protein [Rubrivivax sp.]|nr:LemA family protein [Rubrivivax sp.]